MSTGEDFLAKKVLLIESDKSIQDAILDVVKGKGHELIAGEIEHAIALAAVELPDLVMFAIGDFFDKEINFLRDFRIIYPDIPLIIMTSSLTKEQIVEIAKLKPSDVLVKPLDLLRISNRIDDLVGTDEKGPEVQLNEILSVPKEKCLPDNVIMVNVNELVPGHKVASVVERKGVIIIEKGTILTKTHIENLTNYGVEEIPIFCDPSLKTRTKKEDLKVEQKDKRITVFKKKERASLRLPFFINGKYRDVNQEKFDDCIIIDISSGGVGILTKEKLSVKNEIIINFTLEEDFLFENVKGEVRYSTYFKNDRFFNYRSGILFKSITKKFQENLISKLFEIQRRMIQQKNKRKLL